VENEYYAKQQRVLVNRHESIPSSDFVVSATASESGQSSFDQDDVFSDDEEYLMPINVAETTPRRSDGATPLITATRLYLNSLPDTPKN